jgi:hypothetical protein
VAFPRQPLLQGLQQTLQLKGHLRHQAEIHLAVGQHRIGGDKVGVPAHQFDQADAVSGPQGFAVGRVNGSTGLGAGRVEAEGLLDEGDVVSNGLGDADDPDL